MHKPLDESKAGLVAKPLDTHIEIVTPENIAFQYRVAGPFRRLPAFLIDTFLQSILGGILQLILVLGFAVVGFWGVGLGIALILAFVLTWFYYGIFEALMNGQTPGKRLMQIRVVTADAQPIYAWQAILRNFFRPLDAFPGGYQIGLIAALCNDRFQRMGDLFSGTMVVVEERQRLYDVLRVNEPSVVQLAATLPGGFQVSRSLARALAGYVQRRQSFAWGRRFEIARHLGEPLRIKLNLPANVSHDLLLCALYHRTFIADRPGA